MLYKSPYIFKSIQFLIPKTRNERAEKLKCFQTKFIIQQFILIGVCGAFCPWTPGICLARTRSGAFGQNTRHNLRPSRANQGFAENLLLNHPHPYRCLVNAKSSGSWAKKRSRTFCPRRTSTWPDSDRKLFADSLRTKHWFKWLFFMMVHGGGAGVSHTQLFKISCLCHTKNYVKHHVIC